MSSRATIRTFALPGRFETRRRFTAPLAYNRRNIRVLNDLAYARDGEERHKLDLYLPARDNFPLVVFAHGGSWRAGDKSAHGTFGTFLARNGIGAALVNYRLWPRVRHPGPAQDLARAFAWMHGHATEVGADADRLFLCGHSAGAHSAALLGSDSTFLRTEGLTHRHVAGVIAASGVYQVNWTLRVYGVGDFFRGADAALASPLGNVRPGCPPFLVLHAQREIWTLGRQARRFHARLLEQRCQSRLVVARGENHRSIIDGVALPAAESGEEIVRFVREA